MKKNVLLLLLLFCALPLLFSQNNENLPNVNIDSVEKRTTLKFRKMVLKHSFPKDYQQTLELSIADFEYNKALFRLKYKTDTNLKMKKIDSIKLSYELWKESQVIILKKANKIWDKVSSRHELSDKHKIDFVNYHFYLELASNDESLSYKVNTLAEEEALVKVAKIIAKKETSYVLAKCSAVKKLDSAAIKYARKKLFSFLKKKTIKKLENRKKLFLKRDSNTYCDYASKAVAKKEKEITAEKKLKNDSLFIAKSIQTGLKKKVAVGILKLIEQRELDLIEQAEKNKKAKNNAELFDNTAIKSKSQIKQEFAKSLSELINTKQFSSLFGGEFKKISDQKTNEKTGLNTKSCGVIKNG